MRSVGQDAGEHEVVIVWVTDFRKERVEQPATTVSTMEDAEARLERCSRRADEQRQEMGDRPEPTVDELALWVEGVVEVEQDRRWRTRRTDRANPDPRRSAARTNRSSA